MKASVDMVHNDDETLGPFVKQQVAPDPSRVQTHDEYKEFVKDFCGTTYHPIGTCSMLPQQDGGVVDQDLLVYGTENVRGACRLYAASRAMGPPLFSP